MPGDKSNNPSASSWYNGGLAPGCKFMRFYGDWGITSTAPGNFATSSGTTVSMFSGSTVGINTFNNLNPNYAPLMSGTSDDGEVTGGIIYPQGMRIKIKASVLAEGEGSTPLEGGQYLITVWLLQVLGSGTPTPLDIFGPQVQGPIFTPTIPLQNIPIEKTNKYLALFRKTYDLAFDFNFNGGGGQGVCGNQSDGGDYELSRDDFMFPFQFEPDKLPVANDVNKFARINAAASFGNLVWLVFSNIASTEVIGPSLQISALLAYNEIDNTYANPMTSLKSQYVIHPIWNRKAIFNHKAFLGNMTSKKRLMTSIASAMAEGEGVEGMAEEEGEDIVAMEEEEGGENPVYVPQEYGTAEEFLENM